MQSTQLTLGISLKDEATFANFYPGKNAEIITELSKTASNQGEKVIYLYGARGQGCSHLLQACCHHAHQHRLGSVYLPLADLLSFTPEIVTGLESLSIVCLDNLDAIAGNPMWEETIFHLYNRVFDSGGHIIIAANESPKTLKINLPDLLSRLSFGMVYQLHPLQDEEKITVLIKRARERGMNLPEDVAKYILTHSKRHMGSLLSVLETLDTASLVAKRRLTIPFVKEILQLYVGKN